MAGRPGGVSITDVAKKAGVSVSTVSRVFNGGPSIRKETQRRVLKAADCLGFKLQDRRPGPKPDMRGRRKEIYFITIHDQYHVQSDIPSIFLSLQEGLRQEAHEHDIIIHNHFISTKEDLSKELKSRSVAGYVLRGFRPHLSVEKYLKEKPCCWVMSNPWTPTWGDHVMPDHHKAGIMAAKYLIEHGCRKPVVVALGLPCRVSSLREEGFLYEVKKQGKAGASLIARHPLSGEPRVFPEGTLVDEIIERFKKEIKFADGLFFDDDHSMAVLYPIMVREKMIQHGKTVLIGCNNQQPFLKGIKPHPATMDIHPEQIGKLGLAQLIWRMKNRCCQRVNTLVAPQLIALR